MGLIIWLVVGGLAGWIASKIMNTDAQMGIVLNVVVGIVGALLGGFLWGLITGDNKGISGFNIGSFLIAIVGAVILLAIVKAVTGRKATR